MTPFRLFYLTVMGSLLLTAILGGSIQAETWTDRTGQYNIEAEYVGVEGANVVLRKMPRCRIPSISCGCRSYRGIPRCCGMRCPSVCVRRSTAPSTGPASRHFGNSPQPTKPQQWKYRDCKLEQCMGDPEFERVMLSGNQMLEQITIQNLAECDIRKVFPQ